MAINWRERWDVRLRRARELAPEYHSAAEALRFYEAILQFQRDLAAQPMRLDHSGRALRERIDVDMISAAMGLILCLCRTHGPEKLKADALRLEQAGEEEWRRLIQSALDQKVVPTGMEEILSRACLQPVAEKLQAELPEVEHYVGSRCPACQGVPQMAILRPEGEGSKRWLLCSFCLREWAFRRIICPWCGEEDKEKLPRYTSEECDYIYIDACDACKRYLKVVDLSVNGLAVPLVDEAGLAVLDVWAAENGYQKIVPNLIGF